VSYEDAEPSGLAAILGGLIEQNLEREPGRARYLRPATVSIEAPDADVGATLTFSEGSVSVSGRSGQRAQLEVTAEPSDLLALTAAPLRFGFPDPFQEEGREIVRSIVSRRVRIAGLIRHPLRLRRLTLLLSVALRSSQE
jgi:hypothetical protein